MALYLAVCERYEKVRSSGRFNCVVVLACCCEMCSSIFSCAVDTLDFPDFQLLIVSRVFVLNPQSDFLSNPTVSIRAHTLHLHDALYQKWPQSCDPSHLHRAQLHLDLPSNHIRVGDVPKFHFSFSLEEHDNAPAALPWTWRDVRLISLPQSEPSIP